MYKQVVFHKGADSMDPAKSEFMTQHACFVAISLYVNIKSYKTSIDVDPQQRGLALAGRRARPKY